MNYELQNCEIINENYKSIMDYPNIKKIWYMYKEFLHNLVWHETLEIKTNKD